jgi:hypothetical protein
LPVRTVRAWTPVWQVQTPAREQAFAPVRPVLQAQQRFPAWHPEWRGREVDDVGPWFFAV